MSAHNPGVRIDGKTTKERILEQARSLFFDQGYAQTSIRQIGAAAGVSSGALYKHFANKEEILNEILKPVVSEFWELCDEAFRAYTQRLDHMGSADDLHQLLCEEGQSGILVIELFEKNIQLWRFIFFSSAGTSYENFFTSFCEWEYKITILCMETIARIQNFDPFTITTREEVYSLIHGYYALLIDSLREGFPEHRRRIFWQRQCVMFGISWLQLLDPCGKHFVLRAHYDGHPLVMHEA